MDCVGREARPDGEVAILNGLDPCGWHVIATDSVHELDEFGLCGGVIGAVGLCGGGGANGDCLESVILCEWDLP